MTGQISTFSEVRFGILSYFQGKKKKKQVIKPPATHPHSDESLSLCAGLRQPITVTLAAAQRVSYRQPKCVWLTAVTVVSFYVGLK